jgi:hypothetical protein
MRTIRTRILSDLTQTKKLKPNSSTPGEKLILEKKEVMASRWMVSTSYVGSPRARKPEPRGDSSAIGETSASERRANKNSCSRLSREE